MFGVYRNGPLSLLVSEVGSTFKKNWDLSLLKVNLITMDNFTKELEENSMVK